jgi:hypothetical protein
MSQLKWRFARPIRRTGEILLRDCIRFVLRFHEMVWMVGEWRGSQNPSGLAKQLGTQAGKAGQVKTSRSR